LIDRSTFEQVRRDALDNVGNKKYGTNKKSKSAAARDKKKEKALLRRERRRQKEQQEAGGDGAINSAGADGSEQKDDGADADGVDDDTGSTEKKDLDEGIFPFCSPVVHLC
jgi:hypothetical protein